MPAAPSVVVSSPAKINLHLDILRRRDDGFHDLATIFQAIDLEDELSVGFARGETDELVVRDAPGLAADASNLVLRAAALLRSELGATTVPPLAMELAKRIPMQAGLGGGSSNAAAALVGIDALLGLKLGDAALERLAAKLGSDCAFFVRGGTAVGGGRGEILAPVPRTRDLAVVLVVPPCAVPTREAFAMLRPEELGPRTDVAKLLAWLRGEDLAGARIHNTFQEPARRRWPAIDDALRVLEGSGVEFALLSGSGSACFAICNRGLAEELSTDAPHGGSVFVCRPIGCGVVA